MAGLRIRTNDPRTERPPCQQLPGSAGRRFMRHTRKKCRMASRILAPTCPASEPVICYETHVTASIKRVLEGQSHVHTTAGSAVAGFGIALFAIRSAEHRDLRRVAGRRNDGRSGFHLEHSDTAARRRLDIA
jgi:hypothetical protein